MAPLDGPNKLSEMPTPEEVIAVAKEGEAELATHVEQVSPAVDAILADIDQQPEEKQEGLLEMITKGIEKISVAIKGKQWTDAFTSFTDLLGGVFSASSAKPSYWQEGRNTIGDRLTDHDVGVVLNKIQTGGVSMPIGKKLAYARLVSRRRDADAKKENPKTSSLKEPEQTEKMLAFQISKERIGVGDVITLGGAAEGGGGAKEKVLQEVVNSDQTHAAVVTNLDPLEITHATSAGVHTMKFIDYLTKHGDLSYAVISGGGTLASEYAKQQQGKKYDAVNGVARKFGDDSSMFCSELALRALAAANKVDLDELEKEGKVFPPDIIALSYPKYVGDYPREIVTLEQQEILA